ncbi:MAG: Hsp70 family protein, partial [Treponema sp.]
MKAIGIKLADGTFYPIIGDAEPSEKELVLTTVKDNQTRVIVDLYRTDTDSIEDAEYVDSLQIDNLVAHPNGSANISLTITLDENGKLSAFMRDPETGATSNSNVTLISRTLEERLAPANYDIVDSPKDDEEYEERSVNPEETELQNNESDDNKGEKILAAGAGLAAGGLLAAAAAARKDSSEDKTVADNGSSASDDFAIPDFDDTEFEGDETSDTEPAAAENLPDDNADNTDVAGIMSSEFGENNIEDTDSNTTPVDENSADKEAETDLQENIQDDRFDDFALPDFDESSAADTDKKSSEETKDDYDFDMPDFDDTEFEVPENAEDGDVSDNDVSGTNTDKTEEFSSDTENFDLSDFNDIEDNTAPSENGDTVQNNTADSEDDDIILNDAENFDKTVTGDSGNMFADDFALPDFDEITPQTSDRDNIADESENDDVLFSDEPALEDSFDFSENDKDDTEKTSADETVAGGGLLAAANEKIAQDSEETFPDFSLPDFDETDLQNTGSTSSYNDDFMEEIDTMDSKHSKESSTPTGINFDGLYDKETMEGNSYHDDDDEIKKKTKTPVIICIICAIICIIATLLILFVVPSKYNLLTKAHKTENVNEITETKPEPSEPEPEQEIPPVIQAKEEEIVIAPEP